MLFYPVDGGDPVVARIEKDATFRAEGIPTGETRVVVEMEYGAWEAEPSATNRRRGNDDIVGSIREKYRERARTPLLLNVKGGH